MKGLIASYRRQASWSTKRVAHNTKDTTFGFLASTVRSWPDLVQDSVSLKMQSRMKLENGHPQGVRQSALWGEIKWALLPQHAITHTVDGLNQLLRVHI